MFSTWQSHTRCSDAPTGAAAIAFALAGGMQLDARPRPEHRHPITFTHTV
ncbi:hypothetical protein SK069_17690 [Patulibacter brassicae]|jgi:hypothetical protein|uniref:Uncharacterized protein n=1 Tax=Patulibacter brassicae TaxID=1705717 RepID=A0ABU4VPR4_9ACTN|nr:hypothetical protein [Patulibacter brassicae]MDX8153435.1 hypothetical protein [Patulibacter brassicae]